MRQEIVHQKTTPVVFKGKTSEYFGIWIVNLLLSLITLGIYSAWAKVRRKKYFYHNTFIEQVGFDYHAKPISILKGRIIAFVFLLAYVFGAYIHPFVPALSMLMFFIALPWLVVRGSLFNARNTSHRGLRFDFFGTTAEAVKVFILLPLLIFFTLGLIIPYISHEKSQFLVNGHRFGLSQFEMSRVVKQFYKVYLVLLMVPLLIGILVAIAIPAYQQYVKKPANHAQVNLSNVSAFVAIDKQAKLALAAEETTEAGLDSELQSPPEEAVLSEETAAENVLTEAEKQKLLEEMLQKQQQESAEEMREAMLNPAMWIGMTIALLAYLLFIFGFIGYLQARIGQLVWNNTALDKLAFNCQYRARDFIWLYFSNMLMIMLTFGLATPWAQIRMAKYRASKLHIVGDVDFDQFVGDKKAEVKATGEEMAEMFDVDLSFG